MGSSRLSALGLRLRPTFSLRAQSLCQECNTTSVCANLLRTINSNAGILLNDSLALLHGRRRMPVPDYYPQMRVQDRVEA